MRIAVCLKQIPRLDEVRFHPKTKRVVRDGLAMTTNPLDLLALAHALALREAAGGEVVAVTMGPPQSRDILDEAIQRGADQGILLTDRRFAGADTLATVRALARVVHDYDLVLLGRSSLDGATAQVAPQLAELLDLPQVTQATGLRVRGRVVVVERESDDGGSVARVTLPAVVSVLRGPAAPAPLPGRSGPISELCAEDIGGGARDYGTRGSPTFVKAVREISPSPPAVVHSDLSSAVELLQRMLVQASNSAAPDTARATALPADGLGGRSAERTVWALSERRSDGSLHPTSFETIACARSVAGPLNARVVAVTFGDAPEDDAEELSARGADGVLVLADPALRQYSTAPYVAALSAAIAQRAPDAVIGPWTSEGRDYLPRVAARLGLGLTGDFVALEVADPDTDDPDLLWVKPAWAGTVEALIIAHTKPSMGTLRPGAVPALRRRVPAEVTVDVLRLAGPSDNGPATESPQNGDAARLGLPIDSAPVLVSVGAGSSPALVSQARELAKRCDGVVVVAGAEAVAQGLVPPQSEVGILRRSVSPRVFVALGPHSADDLAAARRARFVATVGEAATADHNRVDAILDLEPDAVLARLLADLPGPH